MGRTEKSIIIKTPPEKVWALLALDRFPEWIDFESVKYTSAVQIPQDRYRVGATALETPKGGPPNNCHFEVTESLEHEKFTHRMWENTFLGTLGGFLTYPLEPVEKETKFTYLWEYKNLFGIWGIFGRFLDKLFFHRWAEKQMQKALENLKSILEQ